MTVPGESPGRPRSTPDSGPTEASAPIDVDALERLAVQLFNESVGRPVPGADAPAPVPGEAVGLGLPPAGAGSAAADWEPAWLAAPESSWERGPSPRPAPVGTGGWAPPGHPYLDPGAWVAAVSPRATGAGPDVVDLPDVRPILPWDASTTVRRQHAAPDADFYFVEAGPSGRAATAAAPFFDVERVRRDFPILSESVNGHRLVWFDNAATTQKPHAVIDRLARYYAHENSNVHRGAHELAVRSTDAYEAARDTVARFLGASSSKEIVFTRGTTEAINLVAHSWGGRNLAEGDEVILSHLEHHANIVPWQHVTAARGAHLKVVPVDDDGQVLLEEFAALLSPRTRLIAVAHVSNALGTIVPVAEMVAMARTVGARVLVDGAQSVAHMPVDVQEMDPDFFVFSGHKIFGPTGIGALWAKAEVLADMPPWQGGGNMIRDVTFERTFYADPPDRFEAGTGNIADAVGLAAALEYVEGLGRENVHRYEQGLLRYAIDGLRSVPGLRLIGTAPDKASVLSFVLDGFTPEAVATALDQHGIAVRAGHHCAQPILRRFGYEATLRASLAFYNTRDEVDTFVAVLREVTASARRG